MWCSHAGFCGETDEEHEQTLDLLRTTCFDNAFLFSYSERAKTHAARHLADNVPPEVKAARLKQAQYAYREGQQVLHAAEVGRVHLVLVEGRPKKGGHAWSGRTCTMKRVVFDDAPVPGSLSGLGLESQGLSQHVSVIPGDYVAVQVLQIVSNSTLLAQPLARTSIREFVQLFGSTTPGQVALPWTQAGNRAGVVADHISVVSSALYDMTSSTYQQTAVAASSI